MSKFFRKHVKFPFKFMLSSNSNHTFNSILINSTQISSQIDIKEKPPSEKKKNKKTLKTSSINIDTANLKKSSSHEKSPLTAHKRLRLRFTYADNYSAALALPIPDKELEENKDNPKNLLQKSQKQIMEHAARRVDLFFYTLVAYYNTKAMPLENHTILQHGIGRHSSVEEKGIHSTDKVKSITQACHSSFFTGLVDCKMQKKDVLQKNLLDGTHFLDSLNATVELPAEVNRLDDELEIKFFCRDKSLKILQNVAKGVKNPIEGLSDFLSLMDIALSEIETPESASKRRNSYLFKDSLYCPLQFKKDLIEIMKKGTLVNKWDSDAKTVINEYVEMLLRLKPKEKKGCLHSWKKRDKIYFQKMKEIQKEILNTKSSLNRINPKR